MIAIPHVKQIEIIEKDDEICIIQTDDEGDSWICIPKCYFGMLINVLTKIEES